jgi:hypothetical protein
MFAFIFVVGKGKTIEVTYLGYFITTDLLVQRYVGEGAMGWAYS